MDFLTCGVCKTTYTDKCELNIWAECDSDGKELRHLMICKSDACQQWIDNAPLLYTEVPWGAGGPGKFTLICGPCKYREGFTCTHPNYTANGGPGLAVDMKTSPLGNITICTADGRCIKLPPLAVGCEGLRE